MGIGGGEAVDVGCGVFVGGTVVGVGTGVFVASGWVQEIATAIKTRTRTPTANVTLRKLEPPCGNRTVRTLPQESHLS